ncbi:MAG: vWA domain-containing protein [Oligoflexus sp.]
MFLPFLFHLRARGLPVGTSEWLTLMEALERGHAGESMSRFYYLCRAICARNEADYDLFDQSFLEFFEGANFPADIKDEFLEWLENNPKMPRALSEEEKARLQAMNLDELRELFEKRLEEQKERHDGGNRWIGTGGTSPFGHSGYHPSGIRVGGQGLQQRAMQIAAQRKFRNFRKDLVIDIRQMGVALKKLRQWGNEGAASELDLEETIDATSRNAGEIEMVFRRPRRNAVKLLLLMDTGGSMTYHSEICDQLFSAAVKINHFKELHHYYFHNCPYEQLYSDMEMDEKIPTMEVLQQHDPSWFLLVVGDAAMSPYELTEVGGAIDYYHQNQEPGYVWLQRIKAKFPKCVWLNPEPPPYWEIPSNQIVRRIFPHMFPLTVDGLEAAIQCLKRQDRGQKE